MAKKKPDPKVTTKLVVKQSKVATASAKPAVAKKTQVPAPAKKNKVVVGEIIHSDDDEIRDLSADEIVKVPDQLIDQPTNHPDEDFDGDDKLTFPIVPAAKVPATSSLDPLVSYLNEIRNYPVLTKEKESEIARKYFDNKDPASAELLVKSNLRFVVKVAAEYSKFGARMIDLIQEGNVGLMHAVKEYNPYKGARLITYAVWWIRGYIQEYLMRQYSIVRIGTTQNQRKLFYQLQKERRSLDALGQEPNLALLSSRLGLPEDEISVMAQRMSGRDVSLDKPLDDESGSSLGDLQRAPSDESLDDKLAREEQLEILKEKIAELRPTLNEREKILLEERILNDDPLTLQEIGEKYGITREAVRQAEVRLMKKIRDKMETA